MRRVGSRLAAVVAVLFVVLPAATASAHAVLDNSVPASGATLADSPPQIVLDFDERVETSLGFIKLFASTGQRITLSTIRRDAADPSIVRVDVPTLEADTYVAAYRVVSADGHPVDGAITFQVGEGKRADVSRVVADALAQTTTDSAVSDAMRAVRLVGYLVLALLVASLVFLFGGHTGDDVRRRLSRIVGAAGALVAVSAAFLIGLQGAAVAGTGIGSVFNWSNVSGVLDTRTGHALCLRVIVAVIVGVAFTIAESSMAARFAGILALVVLPLTFAFAGHPGAVDHSWLAVGASVVHIAAVTFWFGGLLLLVSLAGLRVDATVKWFSQRAAAAIVVVAVSGVVQSVLIVDDLGSIADITYGKTLIAKVVLVGAMLLSAAVVRRRFLDTGVSNLRSVLVVEAAIGLIVLAVTAGLVAETPRALSSSAPFSTSLVQGETIVNVTLSPARVGSVEIHVIVSPPGGSLDAVASARVRLSLADRGVPPINVDATSVGPNHFVGTTAIPYSGDWKLDVIIVDAADSEILFTTTAPIRP